MKDDSERPPHQPPEKGTHPRPEPPGLLRRPLDFGPLDKPVDLAACREFFSLNGGSILYCLSAMCIIYGIAAILGPVFARSFVLGETLPCIVALNVYEIALLAVLLVIVIWQDVTDDAISLVVLAGVFLVVSGIALTTTSNSQPRWVLLIGACSFVLAMGKLFVLRRFIGMSISPVLWGGLAVVLGWNFLAGARLADATTTKTIGREQWLLSWLVLLVGGVIVVLDAALRRAKSADASSVRVPFLRRPAMGWIFALVLLVAAGVHQRALAYVFDVRSAFIDYLPLVSVLSLVSLHLALRLRSEPAYFETGLAAVPLAAFLFALIEGPVLEKPALGIQLLWYPPVFLGLTGIAVLLMSKRCRTLLPVVPFYALGVVLTLTCSAATPADLHWHLSGALLVSGLFLVGLVRRSAALCILAVVLGTLGFAATDAFEGFTRFLGLSDSGAVLGLAALGTLVVALLFGRMPSAVLVLAAFAIMICTFDLLPSELGKKDLFAVPALLVLGAGLWMRLRHWPSVVILCVPIGYRLVVASVLLASWRYVLLGFVLLFAGASLSIRKGKRARREAAAAGPAGPDSAPTTAPRSRATDPSSSPPPGA
ncbi:MAG: hypothetical protein AMS16_06445 [Planctomycetes bacterium DG_58]|nr:MAG: hypothetical protein AMS16_06445 [Planctomycetes bacterium DG_58]